MSSRGPVVVVGDGTRVATRRHGPPSAPCVVLQHGVGSSVAFLEEALVGPLVAAGWQVVAAPLRGHRGAGVERDPAGHALDRLAADVVALVAATGATVCGGVSIAAHAAAIAVADGDVPAPVRVLAVLPAWIDATEPGVGPHAAVAAEVRAVGVAGMWQRLAASDDLRPWLRRVLLRDLVAHDEASLAAALLAVEGGVGPTRDQLRALPPGTAVVGWEGDPGHPLEVAHRWAMTAPGATLATASLGELDVRLDALGHAAAAALGPPLAAGGDLAP